jgi:hypothetical protein
MREIYAARIIGNGDAISELMALHALSQIAGDLPSRAGFVTLITNDGWCIETRSATTANTPLKSGL